MLLKTIKNHWKMTLFVLFFLPLLLHLGFWQLDRAEEKRQLLAVYQQQGELPAIPLAAFMKSTKNKKHTYQKVIVDGVYDTEKYWLLDNRSRGGRAGYEVLMPLRSDQGLVLVNRGWIEALPRRDQLPLIESPVKQVTIEGYLHPFPANAVIDHSESDLAIEWPKRVLQLDKDSVQHILQTDIYPLLVRIDDNMPGTLITEWSVINTKPEKHHGYAVQWFAMAIALLALYLWLLLRERQSS
ncbi:MAG: SURF1 family protein [Cellvibrionaceae bacterium]